MEISTAQADVRGTFLGGFAGQLVSAAIWALSSALATWDSHRAGVLVLVFGGMAIFPLTQLVLRSMGRVSSLPKGHPMNALGMQVAFVLPLHFPLIYAATVNHASWFYPAFMIAVGAHYLPFIFSYGMWQFGVLSALLVSLGTAIGVYEPPMFSLGGWLTAATLLIFAFTGRWIAKNDVTKP